MSLRALCSEYDGTLKRLGCLAWIFGGHFGEDPEVTAFGEMTSRPLFRPTPPLALATCKVEKQLHISDCNVM